ncbi:MAG: PadR family transcriptional regulator [Cyanobacteria bacterium P01_D01_bin.73]
MNKKIETRTRGDGISQTEEILLTVLYGQELYGVQIPQAISEVSGGKRKVGMGTLYPTLHKLEKKGFISSRWGDESREERGGARRRYYKLTGEGMAALEAVQSFRTKLLEWQPS